MKKPKKKLRFICGTPAGYTRHLRRNEHPCRRCLIGSATYSAEEIVSLIEDFQIWSSEQHLWKAYQLSHDRFEQIFTAQGRCCACCSNTDPGKSPWRIDHDPQTDLIRGILCTRCNEGLEQLGDDLTGLQRAVIYLQAHQARGGYEKAKEPPQLQQPPPRISAVMQKCFNLFKQGAPCHRIVILLKLTPATVDEIYQLWQSQGGAIDPICRHLFKIPKDLPQRFMCSCGYSAPWKDPDEMNAAVKLVNAHIEEAVRHPEAEWQRLATAG